MVNDVTSCEYETMMGVMIFQSYYYISAYSRFLLCTFPTHHMYIDICLSRDWSPKFETELNIGSIVQKVWEWPICPFAKMTPLWVHHFDKRRGWSLLYFLIYVYLNISACRKFSLSLYIIILGCYYTILPRALELLADNNINVATMWKNMSNNGFFILGQKNIHF